MKVKHLLQCHLLVPGVLPELAAGGPQLSGLEGLLAFADRAHVFDGGPESWLCNKLGAKKQNDIPAAPFSALGDGLAPGEAYWLRADPVHLHLLRDSLNLADCKPFDLAMNETLPLLDTLNRHFAVDGLQFLAQVPNRWYVQLPAKPNLVTTPLDEAVGRDVDAHLPQGADAMQWHRWTNEVQMLLHDHPVNLEREQRGQLPVNSIWPWGGGVLQKPNPESVVGVWAEDVLARGLAKSAGILAGNAPDAFAQWRHDELSSEHLIVLDWLDESQLRQHPARWHDTILKLDQLWFQPLLANLKAGTLGPVHIHLADFSHVCSFTVERTQLWKFWRRPKPLETYLHG